VAEQKDVMSIFFYFFIGLMAFFGIGWLLIAIATVVIQLLCDLIRLMVTSIGYLVIDCYDLIRAKKERRFAAASPTLVRIGTTDSNKEVI
jgi:hypothetical protein